MILTSIFLAPVGIPLLGYIIPTIIFIISFVVTWALYRHFSKH